MLTSSGSATANSAAESKAEAPPAAPPAADAAPPRLPAPPQRRPIWIDRSTTTANEARRRGSARTFLLRGAGRFVNFLLLFASFFRFFFFFFFSFFLRSLALSLPATPQARDGAD